MPLSHQSSNYLSFNAECHNSESEAGWQSSLSRGSGAGPNLPFLPDLRKPNVQPRDAVGRCSPWVQQYVGFPFLPSWPEVSKPWPFKGSQLPRSTRSPGMRLPRCGQSQVTPHGKGKWSPPAQKGLPLDSCYRSRAGRVPEGFAASVSQTS